MNIRREMILVVILILVIAVLVGLVNFYKKSPEEADARNFIKEDLASKYQGADISIIDLNNKTNQKGERYFEIKAKVTQNPDSACPIRTHIYYNYPDQNFVPQPSESITKDCKVCEESSCVIAYPEEAIIASHTMPGTEQVQSFLRSYNSAKPKVEQNGNSWKVIWNHQLSDVLYTVDVSSNGSILSVTKTSKGSI